MTGPPASAKHITSGTGHTADPPTSPTSNSSAGNTTARSTSTTTKPAAQPHANESSYPHLAERVRCRDGSRWFPVGSTLLSAAAFERDGSVILHDFATANVTSAILDAAGRVGAPRSGRIGDRAQRAVRATGSELARGRGDARRAGRRQGLFACSARSRSARSRPARISGRPSPHCSARTRSAASCRSSSSRTRARGTALASGLVLLPLRAGAPGRGIWLAVTRATLANGCLHVLPGSHVEPVHEHVPDPRPGANYGYVEIVDHDMARASRC